MKSLFGKVLAGALGFAAAIGISAFAADITGLKVEVPAELPTEGTATVTVAGKIAPGAEATILVAEENISLTEVQDTDIQYINQNTVDSEGNFSFKAVLKVGAKYNVWCGGTEVAQVGKDEADLTLKAADTYKIMGTFTVAGNYKDATAVATPAAGEAAKGTVDENGAYTIEVAPGTYEVVIGKPGYLYKTYSGVEIKDSDRTLETIGLIAGQLNDDNVVDVEDLALLLQQYRRPELYSVAADLNDDGIVDVEDLALLLQGYRKSYN